MMHCWKTLLVLRKTNPEASFSVIKQGIVQNLSVFVQRRQEINTSEKLKYPAYWKYRPSIFASNIANQGVLTCQIVPVCIHQTTEISRKEYVFPELHKNDLEISVTKGSGPGGQSVNKSSNCVRIKHIPTGLHVRVHDTRSLQKNKELALKRLQEKLDDHINGENSYNSQLAKLMAFKKWRSKASSERRRALKKKFKDSLQKESDNDTSDLSEDKYSENDNDHAKISDTNMNSNTNMNSDK